MLSLTVLSEIICTYKEVPRLEKQYATTWHFYNFMYPCKS